VSFSVIDYKSGSEENNGNNNESDSCRYEFDKRAVAFSIYSAFVKMQQNIDEAFRPIDIILRIFGVVFLESSRPKLLRSAHNFYSALLTTGNLYCIIYIIQVSSHLKISRCFNELFVFQKNLSPAGRQNALIQVLNIGESVVALCTLISTLLFKYLKSALWEIILSDLDLQTQRLGGRQVVKKSKFFGWIGSALITALFLSVITCQSISDHFGVVYYAMGLYAVCIFVCFHFLTISQVATICSGLFHLLNNQIKVMFFGAKHFEETNQ